MVRHKAESFQVPALIADVGPEAASGASMSHCENFRGDSDLKPMLILSLSEGSGQRLRQLRQKKPVFEKLGVYYREPYYLELQGQLLRQNQKIEQAVSRIL
jgi:hypothetical protein